METTENRIIQEIISTARLAIAGASEFEPGDNKQVFIELYIKPLFKKIKQGIKEVKGIKKKEFKELICTLTAVELELKRLTDI